MEKNPSTQESMLLIAEDGEVWMVEPLRRRIAERCRCIVRRARSIRARDEPWMAEMMATFVRSRNEALLRVLAPIESRDALMINGVSAIRRARHRATAISLVAGNGVPTATQYEGPLAAIPFHRAALKRRLDDGRSQPVLYERKAFASAPNRVVYAQDFIQSDWEHKVYVVGDALFAFEQRPTMLHPEKLATRRQVNVDPVLGAYARRAAEAVGLEVAGIDFLFDRGEPKVTDVNSNQGLHTFPEGFEALDAYIQLRVARRSRGNRP
jgi:glutathione synthase/RimK-type ligase-like ATP-grasp enzyme